MAIYNLSGNLDHKLTRLYYHHLAYKKRVTEKKVLENQRTLKMSKLEYMQWQMRERWKGRTDE